MLWFDQNWIMRGRRHPPGVEATEWAEGLSPSAGGQKLVGKAGIVPVRRLADKTGLADALSSALVRRDLKFPRDRIKGKLQTCQPTTRARSPPLPLTSGN